MKVIHSLKAIDRRDFR